MFALYLQFYYGSVVRLGLCPRWMGLFLLGTHPSMSSSTFPEEKYFSNGCYCFCKSPPFVFEVWWNFPAGRTAVCSDSPPEFLMCTQGLWLTDVCEARGRLAVPVVVGVVVPVLLVRPRDAIGQLL